MNLPEAFERAIEQPPEVEIHMTDRTFIKQMLIAKAGTYIPQHAHHYSHTSMLAKGRARVWKDGVHLGDFTAPTGILIEAWAKHMFQALEDDTIVYCIHQLDNGETIDSLVAEEHHVVGDL